MTLSKWMLAGIGLALLVGGFAVGRFATPAKILEKDRIVTMDREVETHWSAYVGHTETRKETNTVWVTREVRKPDGTVEIETKGQQGTIEDSKKDEAKQEVAIKEVIKYQEVEHLKLVESPKDRYFVAATAGLDSLKKEGLLLGGQANMRVAGPLYAGLWAHVKPANMDIAGGVAVGFSF
jgi:hypothetical protein